MTKLTLRRAQSRASARPIGDAPQETAHCYGPTCNSDLTATSRAPIDHGNRSTGNYKGCLAALVTGLRARAAQGRSSFFRSSSTTFTGYRPPHKYIACQNIFTTQPIPGYRLLIVTQFGVFNPALARLPATLRACSEDIHGFTGWVIGDREAACICWSFASLSGRSGFNHHPRTFPVARHERLRCQHRLEYSTGPELHALGVSRDAVRAAGHQRIGHPHDHSRERV